MEDLSPFIEEQAGNLREGMGIAGSRFGDTAARGEGQLRADLTTQLARELSGLRLQQESTEAQALAQAISGLFSQGQQNVLPAFELASLGILPEDTIVGDSPLTQGANVLSAIASIVGAARGG